LKKHDKLVYYAKIWKPPRQHLAFFEVWRNFGNPQKLLKLGVAPILRHQLTDLSFIYKETIETKKLLKLGVAPIFTPPVDRFIVYIQRNYWL